MLALIAGQGALPDILFAACDQRPLVAALGRFPPDRISPDITFRIETLGTFLCTLKEKGVTEVAFAGSLRRHPIEPAEIDAETMPLVPSIMSALKSGDDAALRIVLSFFEEAGFVIRAAHEIAPELLPLTGSRTKVSPGFRDKEEAAAAQLIHSALSNADVGQAIVCLQGQALAIEGSFGTDWMLESLKNRPDGGGGILYKAPKSDQDRRIDLPTIGPETVMRAADAGLTGIVVEAGGVLVLNEAEVVAEADKSGMYFWVREP